jgi:hypothetical protein
VSLDADLNTRKVVAVVEHGPDAIYEFGLSTEVVAERVRFELTGLSSSGFQVWVRAFAGVRR